MATERYIDTKTGEIWERDGDTWVMVEGPETFNPEDIAKETGILETIRVAAGQGLNAIGNSVKAGFQLQTGDLLGLVDTVGTARDEAARVAPLSEENPVSFMTGQALPFLAAAPIAPTSVGATVGVESLLGAATGLGREFDPEQALQEAALAGLGGGALAGVNRLLPGQATPTPGQTGAPAGDFVGPPAPRMADRVRADIEDQATAVFGAKGQRALNEAEAAGDIPLAELDRVNVDDIVTAGTPQSRLESTRLVDADDGEGLDFVDVDIEATDRLTQNMNDIEMMEIARMHGYELTDTQQFGDALSRRLEALEFQNPLTRGIREINYEANQRKTIRQLGRELNIKDANELTEINPQMMKVADTNISRAFKDVGDKIGSIKLDDEFYDDLVGIQGVRRLRGQKGIDELVEEVWDMADKFGTMTGRELMKNRQDFSQTFAKKLKNRDPDALEYRELITSIDNLIARNVSEEVGDQYAKARHMWRVSEVLKKPAVVDKDGFLNAPTFYNQMKKMFPQEVIYGKRSPLFDHVRLARKYLEKPKSSGTTEGMMAALQEAGMVAPAKAFQRSRRIKAARARNRARQEQPTLTETLQNE